jgi:hypothetical protein
MYGISLNTKLEYAGCKTPFEDHLGSVGASTNVRSSPATQIRFCTSLYIIDTIIHQNTLGEDK